MITLRPYQAEDLDALYAISLATGRAGGDAAHLHKDGRLIGHIYSAPYAALAPELALVATDEGGVAGYVVGAVDTAAWESALERDWWPALRRRYPDPGEVPSKAWTADQRRAFMIHRPAPTPAEVSAAYPAHVHLNLLPRLQGRGAGSSLLETWQARAAEHGGHAVHVGVNATNARALQFWARQGFRPLNLANAGSGRTVWMGRA